MALSLSCGEINAQAPPGTTPVVAYQGGTWNTGGGGGTVTQGNASSGTSTNSWWVQPLLGSQWTVVQGVGTWDTLSTCIQSTGSLLHTDIDNFPTTTTVVQPTGSNLHVAVDSFTGGTGLNSSRTYSASTEFTAGTAPTDVFTITGSASANETIYITQISFAVGGATVPAGTPIQVIKRSTADSGGTSASVTAVPYLSSGVSASATVLKYTANPSSLGNSVGAIITTPAPTTSSTNILALNVFNFNANGGAAIALIGTSQQLCINYGGSSAYTGQVTDANVTWIESP